MPSYQVYCTSCDGECSISVLEGVQATPSFCALCGTELEESNVREDEIVYDDEEAWNRLSEESLGDLDDWKTNE